MDNAKIEYEIEILKGAHAGKTVALSVMLDELEEENVGSFLLQEGHLDCYTFADEYYKILSRQIILTNH